MLSVIRLALVLAVLPFTSLATIGRARGEEWSIPAAGNAFRTEPAPGSEGFRRDGVIAWSDAEAVYSVFFHISRPAALDLAVRACAPAGEKVLRTRTGSSEFETRVEGTEFARHGIGRVEIPQAGYVRVNFRVGEQSGKADVAIRDLLVSADTEGLVLDFVKTSDGNMFYWGRRGPSVHLRYQVPQARELQYAYSEITVPQGQDAIGSFFMANGFGEGYFGFQVNGLEERRVLFSVWSPFKTDDPQAIPEDQRIVTLGKGRDVHVDQFGNEGSGGQSYLIYPWQAGKTYRFLTEVRPAGMDRTVYTSWFGDKASGEWRLIASFERPKTSTYLHGFHAFLENFLPSHGHIGRQAYYGNVWVCDVDGRWHECTKARFSVDATGRDRHRLDFSGGNRAGAFFLRNCGFFDQSARPGATFTRESTAAEQPEIDFEALPRR